MLYNNTLQLILVFKSVILWNYLYHCMKCELFLLLQIFGVVGLPSAEVMAEQHDILCMGVWQCNH